MGEYRSQIMPLYGTPMSKTHWAGPAGGLVAQYTANEYGGLIWHDSAGENHGTLTGMAPMSPTSGWVPGSHGGALAFDGSNDYVDCGNPSSFNFGPGDFSFAAWVYPTSFASNNCVIGKANPATSYSPFRADILNGKWAYFMSSTGASWNLNAQNICDALLNSQQFITVTKKGVVAKFYFNGSLKSTNVAPPSVWTNTFFLVIGQLGYVNTFFSGLISSIPIYNRALSADEIAYLYAFPWCGYEDQAGMQAWLYQKNMAGIENYYRQMRAA